RGVRRRGRRSWPVAHRLGHRRGPRGGRRRRRVPAGRDGTARTGRSVDRCRLRLNAAASRRCGGVRRSESGRASRPGPHRVGAMRRAKIVCTIGPATASAEKIQELVDAGMDVARINRSHGTAEEHEVVYRHVRDAAQASGRAVAVLVDLQGPKIRLGDFAGGSEELAEGDIFTITTEDVPGTKELVSTSYEGLPGDCKPGDRILIDDGKVAVRVLEVDGPRVVTRVEVPGPVSNHKGLNLPGVAVSVPALSEKDKEDLRWGLELGADFIALSFVRHAADIDDVHAIMDEVGRRVPVVAKIE